MSDEPTTILEGNVPSVPVLKETIEAFRESFYVNEEKVREIQQDTRDQRNSSLWHEVGCYRIMSSLFGSVLSC